MKPRIAICKNDKIFNHSELWTHEWERHCRDAGLEYSRIDGYSYNVMQTLRQFDIFLWHPGNYVLADMMEARNILHAAKHLGLIVFPDVPTAWHFDDKIAQSYILQAADAAIPDCWVFYLEAECVEWLKHEATYPLVAKLKSGSGSNNVTLLSKPSDAIRYARKAFSNGRNPAPSIFFKAKSKAMSARSWATVIDRAKRIPEFLRTLSCARGFPNERGYSYFQEFIPNDGYDLKIVVIGDKLSYLARRVRKNEFRASGGGDIFYDRSLVTSETRDEAYRICDLLGSQCMGFDMVVDSRDGRAYIVEMCFGFSRQSVLDAQGYWDRSGNWYDIPLDAPVEVLQNAIAAWEVRR